MLKVGAFAQLACIAAAPLALWFSASTALVSAVDFQGHDAERLVPYLDAVDARIVQINPDGSGLVARGAPGAMAAALLRAGALPLPLVSANNACVPAAGRRV